MLILLPPSETKRPAVVAAAARGRRRSRCRSLAPQREAVIDALVGAVRRRGRGRARPEARRHPARRGRASTPRCATAPTMAGDRPLHRRPLRRAGRGIPRSRRPPLARRATSLIHSAPFGPVGALDPIPAYRLGAAASLPGLPPLTRLWADAVTAALSDAAPSFVLDLRSEAYVGARAGPAGVASVYVRVVSDGDGGAVRALNHFNKHAKGALVRRLAAATGRASRRAPASVRWADAAGLRVRDGAPGELQLFA